MLLMWLCAKTQESVGDDMWSIGRNGGRHYQIILHYVCTRVDTTSTILEVELSLSTLGALGLGVQSLTSHPASRAGELRSAPSEPDDRYRATG